MDESFLFTAKSAAKSSKASSTKASKAGPAPTRPNIIVMQPDDFPFFAEWTPPPMNPADLRPGYAEVFPGDFDMPNTERLRTQGVQMTQAYAAASTCSTSRFSTITGKYPSRVRPTQWTARTARTSSLSPPAPASSSAAPSPATAAR